MEIALESRFYMTLNITLLQEIYNSFVKFCS